MYNKDKMNELIEIKEYNGDEYSPIMDYGAWRVAILNYSDTLLPMNINNMQRHDTSDEVFVLLRGECILFLGEGDDKVDNVYSVKMEPYKAYNIKRGVWHNHTLSKDAKVLIVENLDATDDTSPFINLDDNIKDKIIEDAKGLLS